MTDSNLNVLTNKLVEQLSKSSGKDATLYRDELAHSLAKLESSDNILEYRGGLSTLIRATVEKLKKAGEMGSIVDLSFLQKLDAHLKPRGYVLDAAMESDEFVKGNIQQICPAMIPKGRIEKIELLTTRLAEYIPEYSVFLVDGKLAIESIDKLFQIISYGLMSFGKAFNYNVDVAEIVIALNHQLSRYYVWLSVICKLMDKDAYYFKLPKDIPCEIYEDGKDIVFKSTMTYNIINNTGLFIPLVMNEYSYETYAFNIDCTLDNITVNESSNEGIILENKTGSNIEIPKGTILFKFNLNDVSSVLGKQVFAKID